MSRGWGVSISAAMASGSDPRGGPRRAPPALSGPLSSMLEPSFPRFSSPVRRASPPSLMLGVGLKILEPSTPRFSPVRQASPSAPLLGVEEDGGVAEGVGAAKELQEVEGQGSMMLGTIRGVVNVVLGPFPIRYPSPTQCFGL